MGKKPVFRDGKEFYAKLYFLFNAYIAVSLLPFGLLFLEVDVKGDRSPILTGMLGVVTMGILFIGSGTLFYLGIDKFRKHLKSTTSTDTLRQKLLTLYDANIKKFQLFTASAALSLLGLYLHKNSLFVITYMLVLANLSIFRPSIRKMIKDLRLSESESQILTENQAISQ